MATRTISTKLAIEGEAAYRSALSSINSELKSVNSALKLTKSEFASNATSMEAMRAKCEALKNVQEVQTQKIKALQDALNNAQGAASAYRSKCDELTAKIGENNKALEKLRATAGDTAEEEKRLEAENEALNRELAKNESYLQAAEKGVNSWQTQLNNAKISLNDTNKELAETEKAMKEAGEGANNFGDKIGEAGEEGENCADKMDELAAAIGAAGLTAVIHKLTEALADCIRESMGFETAMAGVKRTVGGSAEFIDGLGESFEELSTTIPITAEELANIATTAGQLGISKDSVEEFTTVMAKLGTTTDLTADTAATMLAQFSNITGVTDFERLGSTVADLGDATATTASKVVEMSQGMAAAANIAGMSATDAMQTIKAANMSSDRETTAYEYGDGAMIRLVEMERKGALDDVFFEHLSGKDWGENTKTNANSMSSDTSPEKLYKVYKKRSCAAFICKEKGGYIL